MEDKCFECEATEDLQQHHVVPRSRGGTKTITLCHSCHMKSHGRDSKGLNQSRLIKEGIARAKARGVKLGNPNLKEARLKGAAATKQKAVEVAMLHGKTITAFIDSGLSLGAIARQLNDLGTSTPSGKGKWHAVQVKRIAERYKLLQEE